MVVMTLYVGFRSIWYTPEVKPEVKPNCNETVEILKQRIEVQQMTNNTQKEMIRKRDSIIYVQDSTIVKLYSKL